MFTEQMTPGPAGQETIMQLAGAGRELVEPIIYKRLIEFNLGRRAVNKDGTKRSEQSLKNELSVIKSWMAFHGVTEFDLVGEELGISFSPRLADYLTDLKRGGKSRQTRSDRKSILGGLRESHMELMRACDLPEDFPGALRHLTTASGLSLQRIANKSGVLKATIYAWIDKINTPISSSLLKIQRLEAFFKLPSGTLSSRLPEAIWNKGRVLSATTPWRKHQADLVSLRYLLHEFPGPVRGEWGDMVSFHTDPLWSVSRGLKVNSEWRVRWNTNICVTAKIRLNMLKSYFGFLCLPATGDDPRMVGMGYDPRQLTVALLGDADHVLKYLNFMKSRAVNKSFNTSTLNFLRFSMAVLRKGTGFLRQHSALGARLPKPVAEGDWVSWCITNYRKISELKKIIKRSKNDGLKMSREPFAAVSEIIRQRPHPISALFELATNMEGLKPLLEDGSEERLASHCRDIFLIRFLSSNPLRVQNIAMMTYIPASPYEFTRACETYRRMRAAKKLPDPNELYLDVDEASNLFQARDGSWWLRFDDRDFKNEKTGRQDSVCQRLDYEVKIVPSVWPSLVDYLFRHRAVLIRSYIAALQKERAGRGFTPLTAEEDLAISNSPYVFQTGRQGGQKLSDEHLLNRTRPQQISTITLTDQVYRATCRYLPGSKGFCAHACRHLVATEYIKNHPRGYDEAAAALRNSVGVVKAHYSWLEFATLIRPWSDYYEQLEEKYNKGQM